MSEKKKFYDYFKESMDALGLPAPDSLFSSVGSAIATSDALFRIVEKYGTRVTVLEFVKTAPKGVFSAAFAGEALLVAGGVTLAFYAGACLGALLYATDSYFGLTEQSSSNADNKIGPLYTRATRLGIKVPKSMFAVIIRNPKLRRTVAV